MKKQKILGKIFGIGLAFVLVGSLVGELAVARAAIPTSGHTTDEDITKLNVIPLGALPTVTINYPLYDVPPQWWMNVSVNVTNADRELNELSNVTFKFWYDSNGGVPTESEFNDMPVSTQDGVYKVWDKVSGFSPIVANDTTFGKASWDNYPDNGTCTAPADLNATSGTFWFNITIGKVARRTTGGDCWQIAVVTDSAGFGTGFGYDPEGVTMNAYSEVNVAAYTTVDWGMVSPGLTWSDSESQQSLGTDVTYIVNGDYTQNVITSANWTGATWNATLDDTGTCGSPQQFSLKANINTTLPAGNLVDGPWWPFVTIASRTITGDGTADGGSGHVESDNTFWLKLASTFIADTYEGVTTYLAAFP